MKDNSVDHMLEMAKHEMQAINKHIPKSTIPEGTSGPWSIKKFKLTKNDLHMFVVRAMLGHEMGRGITPIGDYTKLTHKDYGVVMSDTLDELRDQENFVLSAQGNVLVAGLGLGITAQALCLRKEVEKLTVIEIDKDVISLVKPHLRNKKIAIVHEDIKNFKITKYDCAWYDIWTTICNDNWSEMKTLKRRAQRKIKLQMCWGQRETQEMARSCRY